MIFAMYPGSCLLRDHVLSTFCIAFELSHKVTIASLSCNTNSGKDMENMQILLEKITLVFLKTLCPG